MGEVYKARYTRLGGGLTNRESISSSRFAVRMRPSRIVEHHHVHGTDAGLEPLGKGSELLDEEGQQRLALAEHDTRAESLFLSLLLTLPECLVQPSLFDVLHLSILLSRHEAPVPAALVLRELEIRRDQVAQK